MLHLKSHTLLTCIATMLLGSFTISETANAQLFSRLYQRRSSPDNCQAYRVVVPTTGCCGQQYETGLGYDTYGFTNPVPYSATTPGYSSGMTTSLSPPNEDPYAQPQGMTFNSREFATESAPGYADDNQQGSSFPDRNVDNARWNASEVGSTEASSQQRASDNSPTWNSDQRQTQTGYHDSQEQALTSIYAGKLFLANHCVEELSRLAQDKSTNESVRQFADSLASEHRQLNQKLQQMAPTEIVQAFSGESKNKIAQGDANQDRQSLDNSDRTTVGRVAFDQSPNPIVKQLCDIERQAAENTLESTRQMLNDYSGEDFDMAFIGTQIASHTQMLAHLKATKNVGTSEFQNVVSGALDSVEDHLRKARELSRKLDDDNSRRTNASDETEDAAEVDSNDVPGNG